MMKIIFTAWILVNGMWVHGSNFDGWWPLKTESEAHCRDLIVFSNRMAATELLFTCESEEDTKAWIEKN